MKIEKLLKSAVKAYGNHDVLGDYLKDPTGNFGDALAQFIAKEVSEVVDPDISDDENRSSVVESLQSARQQLLDVIDSISP